MHTIGKVLAFLSVGLALATLVLSTKALHARNSWIRFVETRRTAYGPTIEELRDQRKKLADRQGEYGRLMHLWAPFIADNVTVQPNGQDSIILSIGPAQNLRVDQIVHLFEPTADGGSIYVGPFKVTVADPARSAAVAAWPLRETDRQNWPPQPLRLSGPGYRVYGSVPNSAHNNLIHYAQMLVRKDFQTFSANNLLATRDREIQIANEHLVYRNNELHGDPGLEADRGVLPNFMIDGYVKAIEDADERRNALALQVDDIRHNLKRTYDEVQRLQSRNIELMNSLAPYEEPETSPAVGD
jgi:hypothetical protein